MAAESPRKGSKIGGFLVRPQPVSDKSVMESVVDFIHDVVPQAYSSSPKNEDKEKVIWVKFETSDINDRSCLADIQRHNGNEPPLLLVMGYTNGIQIWCLPANGDSQEVLSLRQGPIRALRILPTPQPVGNATDVFLSKRPLVAMCDSSSAGQPFCSVNFVSLRTGDQVHSIKFKNPVWDIHCNKRIIVVAFQEKIAIFDACSFKDRFWITSCYPAKGPNLNPLSLGTRWLAYADRKLVPVHQSCGGMANEGEQSYTATVIHAAKTITKGLTMFGETVASSLSGKQGQPLTTKKEPLDIQHPGIVTIVDIEKVGEGEVNVHEDSEGEGLIAHFSAHLNEEIAAMAFDPSGMLLLTACRLGHNFHIFRIMAHPCSSSLGSVHHIYTLHRGDTTAKVQDIVFSLDSRWVAVSTVRGTTHVFPITPYGGCIGVRTHMSPRVVNRASRFHKSAGLEEIEHTSTGRNSPVLSGSPGSTVNNQSGRVYDSHPSIQYTNALNNMGNPRLPPYPHPTTIYPLSKIHQPLTFPSISNSATKVTVTKTKSPTHTGQNENVSVAANFAPPRAWLVGSPSVTREKEKRTTDSLFVIGCNGNLVEYSLEPRPLTSQQKITDDSPVELEVSARAQWILNRHTVHSELKPPLSNNNPLIVASDCILSGLKTSSKRGSITTYEPRLFNPAGDFNIGLPSQDEGEWLSQVEIITHAGPHRRLWMGPQFTFKTFQQPANTTILSATSSALLSQSPETTPSSMDIFSEDIDLQSLRINPVRSNPMAMPNIKSGDHAPYICSMPLLIEAGSGSFEQSPSLLEVCETWPEGFSGHHEEGLEDRLMENIADAMAESPTRDGKPGHGTELHGSCEDLSLDSSASAGSAPHSFYPHLSTPSITDHELVFPSGNDSPDSST